MVKFICEGCGIEVALVVEDHIPKNYYCMVCGFVEWSIANNTVKQHMHEHLGTMKRMEKWIQM